MSHSSDSDDDWAELARELARDKPPAPPPPPEAPADDAGFAEGVADTDSGDAETFDEGPETAPGEGETEPGDGQPGTGRKRRRRRRRRRKGGGQPAEATTEVAEGETAEAGDADTEGDFEAATEEVRYDEDDADSEFVSDEAEAEEDAGGELLRELIANWNVPSWDDVVAGLYRPER